MVEPQHNKEFADQGQVDRALEGPRILAVLYQIAECLHNFLWLFFLGMKVNANGDLWFTNMVYIADILTALTTGY